MAKSKKKTQEYFESFVWKPRPACCLKADGTRDYEKLNALIKQAQEWIHEAQMQVFEQYSGTWQPQCIQNDEVMYRMAMDYEDFQQEAFICFLKSLKKFGDSLPKNFRQFFKTNFENRIRNLLDNIEKQIVGHKIPRTQEEIEESDDKSEEKFSICYSMQETYLSGNLKYDFEDTDAENEYFKEGYPQVSKLLTERELQIAIDSYISGFGLKEVAKKHHLSYGRLRNILSEIRKKIQVLKK